MTNPIRWGVIGATSYVASIAVMPAMEMADSAELSAISHRGQSGISMRHLASKKRYSDYLDLLADPDIDAVYLPLPNYLHKTVIQEAIAARKHVLCEKPLAMSAIEATDLFALAKSHGVVLAEAYMTFYHPRQMKLMDLIHRGTLGEIHFISSSFTGTLTPKTGYRYDPRLGGGALRDLGIYVLAPIVDMLGNTPTSLSLNARLAGTPPIDSRLSARLDYLEGTSATINCSFESAEIQNLTVVGSTLSLSVDAAFTPSAQDNRIVSIDSVGRVSNMFSRAVDPYCAMIEQVSQAFALGIEPAWNSSKTIEVQTLVDTILSAL